MKSRWPRIGLEEAKARLQAQLDPRPRGSERVPLGDALQRVLAEDVVAAVDVPGFDRANVDGFALRAADTFGAVRGRRRAGCGSTPEIVTPGVVPER